jgi:NADP-dependent 3-hydroxy acid dehydrogenase YdfG
VVNTGARTALITGASSGIGAAFARRLAQQGYHLILVARREARLQELAAELQQRYLATAEVLAADLSDSEGICRVEERIAAVEKLGLLINNAGFGTYGPFTEVNADRHEDMIQVHSHGQRSPLPRLPYLRCWGVEEELSSTFLQWPLSFHCPAMPTTPQARLISSPSARR